MAVAETETEEAQAQAQAQGKDKGKDKGMGLGMGETTGFSITTKSEVKQVTTKAWAARLLNPISYSSRRGQL